MPALGAPTAKRLLRYTQMWNEDDAPATADAVNQLEPGCYGFVLHKRKDWFPNELKDLLARYELIVHNTADRIQNGTLKLRCIDGSYQLMEYIGEILRETKGISIRWRRVATCNPPEVHDFPLNSKFTGDLIYYKTQESVCTIVGVVHGQFNANSYVSIGYLPEGWRTSHNLEFPLSTSVGEHARGSTTTDGNVMVVAGTENATYLYVSVSFPCT